ncbi:MAG: hypothetical protein ACFB50_05750 [Rubrobacteraceae bacterium]
MPERARAFIRNIQPWQVVVVLLVLLVFVLLIIAVAALGVWFTIRSVDEEFARQEPFRQEPPRVEVAPSRQEPPTLPLPESYEDLPPSQRPEISGLGVMNVLGYLKYGPGGDAFVCSGPSPGRGDTTVWRCGSAPGNGPLLYEVQVTGDGPLSIFSVEATIYDATQEAAAEFLGYVGSLAFAETDPVNVRAWVEGNVASGGQLTASGAELTLYGTNEVRTLVVAGIPRQTTAGGATGVIPQQPAQATNPDDFDLGEDNETN